MGDRIKILFAILFFIGALIFPLVGLGVGWYNWDAKTGLLIMTGVFFFFFILGGLVLGSVRDLSWLTVSLPYLFGMVYTVSPDLMPLAADDALVSASSAILTYALALRKDPGTPKWVILPLIAAAIYMFFGGPIPGPIDELIVNLVALSVAGYGVKRASGDRASTDVEELEA